MGRGNLDGKRLHVLRPQCPSNRRIARALGRAIEGASTGAVDRKAAFRASKA
jgi:hypothetical protein